MASTLEECQRTGHNFVINRDRDGFSCSHGCGERRPRPGFEAQFLARLAAAAPLTETNND